MATRKDILIGLLVVLVIASAGVAWVAPWQGERAPEVHFETLDGERFALDELQGHPTIVAFWATTCTICVQEIPHFKALYEELYPEGLELIAVAMEYDPEDQVRAMAKEREMPYRVVLDRDGSIARAFGDIRLTPTTFLIGPNGEILQQRLGMVDTDKMRERLTGLLPGEQVALFEDDRRG
ncbi:TlpA disulfide reductase family protein [Aquisalimonas sp.]|uniref:TlpA family protein disulfide reductase n=1 Tax=Aquisalimonas sp. TaxID=1872621 RepID=UPI0025BF8FE7|nr:TlpA disulfide reductase family protein [Aquisalimonas sp.]